MRIALVHSFYTAATPSGENRTVLDQLAALRRAGHDAHLVAVHTDDLSDRPWYPVAAAATVATGRGRSPLAPLERLAPDVVHVHNLFPNYADRWVRRWPGPLVCTVHNVRPVCAAGTFVRDGAPCTDCLTVGGPRPALRHRCYRGSLPATAALAWAQRTPPPGRRLFARADRILVPSERARRLWHGTGVPADRLHVLPHFVGEPDGTTADPGRDREGFTWVGRLTPEKGLPELLRSWPERLPLTVLGDGPQRGECGRVAPSGVRFLGATSREQVYAHLARSRALVVTSRCMETFGLVAAEALACGTPVVAVRGSTIADAVRDHGTGIVVDRVTEVADAAARVSGPGADLRAHCRQVYRREYAEPVWTQRATALFRALASGAHPGGTGTRAVSTRTGA